MDGSPGMVVDLVEPQGTSVMESKKMSQPILGSWEAVGWAGGLGKEGIEAVEDRYSGIEQA